MSRTYLITGGAGNLACQLSLELVGRGDRVVLFDIAQQPAARVAEGCQYIRGDLTRREDLFSALKQFKPDSILHFASLLSGSCEQDRQQAWRVNMDGTFDLFEAAVRMNVGQVLFTSTAATYGGRLTDPLPEDFPQWPRGLYGVTKVACERLGVYYHEQHGIDFRCLRLPVVVSQFAPPGAASAYASQAFVQAIRSRRFVFHVRPETRPSIIYIKDALRAIEDLLHAPEPRLTRRVYNIHAIAPSASELAEAITDRISDAVLTFEPDPSLIRLIESWPTTIDDAAARSDWCWQPRYDLSTLADHFIQELRDEFTNAS
jgi:threonine 3-dehydrogenase